MVDFEEIEEIYKKLQNKLTKEDFLSKVENKIIELNGLCDTQAAAMLIAGEVGFSETTKIKDITLDKGNVVFIAKVTSIGEIREFPRDGGGTGCVSNLMLLDDTGSIKAAIWDNTCDLIKTRNIKTGDVLKIKGYVKEGLRGVEVNIKNSESIEHIDEKINVKTEKYKISDIKNGMNNLTLIAKIIEIGSIRTFSRKDGGVGKVKNITIGDNTGKTRLVLWDAKAENNELKVGDIVEIKNAYSRDNTFTNQTELQLGSGGNIVKSNVSIDYSEDITPISDIGINSSYSISGYVSGIDTIHEFERQDGKKGKVANIYVSDNTGRIKVTLWDKHADIINQVDIGSEICIIDAYAKSGRNEEIELSAGSRTGIQILKK